MANYNNALKELDSLLNERFVTDGSVIREYQHDKSSLIGIPPIAVCTVLNEGEIVELIKICAHSKMALIPSGARTSLEGHTLHTKPGISLDISQMNKIMEVSPVDRQVVVEAGVCKLDLNRELEKYKIWYPAGPGINASIGGMLACSASGANAIMYGTVKENIRSVRFIDGLGNVHSSRRDVIKSAAGYDLTQLIVGSEGTLGIITQACLKLSPVPNESQSFVFLFSSLKDAVSCALHFIACRFPMAMLEILNRETLEAMNQYSGTNFQGDAALFIELHLSDGDDDWYNKLLTEARNFTLTNSFENSSFEDKNFLLKTRYDIYYAIQAMHRGHIFVTTDVTVPISKLYETIVQVEHLLKEANLPSPILGHIGDGNFHGILAYDPDNSAEKLKCEQLNHQIVRLALNNGGTCTGEHGVGQSKRKFLVQEFGEDTIGLMKKIKAQFDPCNILNPDKIFP